MLSAAQHSTGHTLDSCKTPQLAPCVGMASLRQDAALVNLQARVQAEML